MAALLGMATRLRIAMKAKGLKGPAAAEACDVPYPTWKNYQAGQPPGAEALLKIRSGLGVNVDWLLSGEGSPFLDAPGVTPSEYRKLDTMKRMVADPTLRAMAQRYFGAYQELEKMAVTGQLDATPESLLDLSLEEIEDLHHRATARRVQK